MKRKYIPLGKISEHLGYDINPATAHRWRQKGVSHNGRRVILPAKKIGSRYFVTEEDLNAFISQLNSPQNGSESMIPASVTDSLNTGQADQILDRFNV